MLSLSPLLINSFRQVYREERKSSPTDHLQIDVNPTSESLDKDPPSSESSGRRRISRVVVEHKDNLETFYDLEDFSYSPRGAGGSINDDVFFDNDKFWIGSITWY